ncbi:MAG: phospho-sugar mutase, partial [Bacteroidales bacterium]|nr:phospho-sugar mutase [Bacteroidales bacterium]
LLTLSLSPEAISAFHDIPVVYTPLHGTGLKMVPEILRRAGFTNVSSVSEQQEINGDFPTVSSPNPEDPAALKMAMDLAVQKGASLVLATDPDADRIGVAVRGPGGNLMLLNGNQTATLLTYYLLQRFLETGRIKKGVRNGGHYMVKTIVTTDLLGVIAEDYGVEMYNVLTGFKYIAAIVSANEGKRYFIGGGEESFGFNAGEYVRDKDAVLSALLVCEAAAWAASQGKYLYDLLTDIYLKFGYFKERLISVTKKGVDGVARIQEIMRAIREKPFLSLAGSDTVLVHDDMRGETIDLVSDLRYRINLPSSDVMQFVSSDNSMISVRPSGTEPKIKYYLAVRTRVNSKEELKKADTELDSKLDRLAGQVLAL